MKTPRTATRRRTMRTPTPGRPTPTIGVEKLATGIAAFDEITGGGLPKARASIVVGAAGTGKTIFSLQVLRHAALARGEASIFVSFEERPEDIVRNVASFDWGLDALVGHQVHLLDGRMPLDVRHTGDADLSGLLAGLAALTQRTGARWVAFDSLDAMLSLMVDDAARRREVMRLHQWIETHGLTCLVTTKRGADWGTELTEESRLSYLVDCVIDLESQMVDTLSMRTLRILKYRGSAHYGNRVPCLIGARGFDLVPVLPASTDYRVFSDRLATGIDGLDAMLGGGILRGSALLLTGAPGTAKTSISSSFVAAACARGETALMVCFDESPGEMVRNLGSIGVHLQPHLDSGRLAMRGMAARSQSAELVFAELHEMIAQRRPDCLVIDPITALLKGGGESVALGALLRIFQLCKLQGITLLMPCIVSRSDFDTESSDIHASTMADVWVHLSYLVRAGERNRLLTVVKARGTAHSNQVRELVLDASGAHLATPYVEDGEVLTGTLRWQKEQQAARARAEQAAAAQASERALADAQGELAIRIAALQREYESRETSLREVRERRLAESTQDQARRVGLGARRGTEPPPRTPTTAAAGRRRRAA
ncbi:circadian clock protein KaiC [Methyloversatilis sp.]|uniref:circadian clock protein KaiC n=1 Tax=Methyloversatilis sp. TaxID=2569862 RepID=UPI003F6EB443